MQLQTRSLLFAIGVFSVIATTLILYRQSIRTASAEKPGKLLASVDQIKPGSYRFDIDLYGRMPNSDARRILFLRKSDGTLKAWYIPVNQKRPAEPDGENWLRPGKTCAPFEIDTEHEEIKCVITDAATRKSIHLRWSWDGKSSGPFAPDMAAVPGKEEDRAFVFDQTSPNFAAPLNSEGVKP